MSKAVPAAAAVPTTAAPAALVTSCAFFLQMALIGGGGRRLHPSAKPNRQRIKKIAWSLDVMVVSFDGWYIWYHAIIDHEPTFCHVA